MSARLRSALRRFAVGLVSTGLLITAPSIAASAATVTSTGAVGPASVGQGTCTWYPAWGRLDMKISPPTVYARNNYAGAGNDWQWVRYNVAIVNSGNQVVTATGFSAWAQAFDNQPAAWTGATTLTAVPTNSRVFVAVEWWNASTRLGASGLMPDSYRLVSNGTGPYAASSLCSKIPPY